MPPLPASQADAIAALWPWLVLIFGGPLGVWGAVKGGLRFARWLHETRAKADNAETVAHRATIDINGLGQKFNVLAQERTGEARDFAHLKEAHEKLDKRFEDHKDALPEILKQERHAIPDSPTGKLVASLDERLENLKEDHGRRIERLEDKNGGRSGV